MAKFELPQMEISRFNDNVLTLLTSGLKQGTDDAAGSVLISESLADLYSVNYADMAE